MYQYVHDYVASRQEENNYSHGFPLSRHHHQAFERASSQLCVVISFSSSATIISRMFIEVCIVSDSKKETIVIHCQWLQEKSLSESPLESSCYVSRKKGKAKPLMNVEIYSFVFAHIQSIVSLFVFIRPIAQQWKLKFAVMEN